MSAESPRKAYKYTCNMVRPQPYSEKSLMESVVDFFSDVVPQAYTGSPRIDDKEKIQWVRFEDCDCNDIAKNPDLFKSDTKGLPLLLILGYSNGIQIWFITPNGEAQEILSIRQGPVRLFRVLPTPDLVLGFSDTYASKRPLAVMCDSSSAGQPYCSVKFISLKTGDEIHSINYKTLTVQNVECNKRFFVTVFCEKVCVYDSCQFKQLFWITSCYPCPGPKVNPIALSTRWLAYADKRLVPMHQSCGGMSGDGSQSYAATVISAAKGCFKGLSMFGEAMVSSVTGNKTSYTNKKVDVGVVDNGDRPGIISVVDLQNIHGDHFNVNEDSDGEGLIAHFHAHANEPVANMAFDSSGTLLVTACKLGHNFHIFRLMAHPCNSSLGAVHHLYTLHRGDTTAKVIDISFNHDTRWVTVSTHRGTTHLFPITPYGGSVNVRTHCQPHVVNRASRFHKSAGLDEIEHNPVGRRSPVLSSSPGSSGQYDRYPSLIQQNTLNNNMGNPRLPPYPHPIAIYPSYQIKQPLNVSMNPANKNSSPTHSPTGVDNIFSVSAKFSTPRLCVVGSPKLGMERRESGKRPVDSLFVLAQSGTLVEYLLEPRARPSSEKVTDESQLDLGVTGRMQWNLQRLKNSPEQRPPLPSNSPLILAKEAVASQIPTAPDLFDLPGLTRQDSKDSLSSDHSGKDDTDEQWLSQVEIITHAGPHRRLWMGPQFSFKTYQNTTILSSNSSSLLSQSPEVNMAAMDITGDEGDLESLKVQPARSNPVTMPTARPAYRRLSGSDSSPTPSKGGQLAPLMIEAGSYDQSPHLCDVYSNWTESSVAKQPHLNDDLEEDKLKETLADAMVESPMKDAGKGIVKQEIARSEATIEEVKKESTENSGEKKEKKKEKGKKKKEISGNKGSAKMREAELPEQEGVKAVKPGKSKTDQESSSGSSLKCDDNSTGGKKKTKPNKKSPKEQENKQSTSSSVLIEKSDHKGNNKIACEGDTISKETETVTVSISMSPKKVKNVKSPDEEWENADVDKSDITTDCLPDINSSPINSKQKIETVEETQGTYSFAKKIASPTNQMSSTSKKDLQNEKEKGKVNKKENIWKKSDTDISKFKNNSNEKPSTHVTQLNTKDSKSETKLEIQQEHKNQLEIKNKDQINKNQSTEHAAESDVSKPLKNDLQQSKSNEIKAQISTDTKFSDICKPKKTAFDVKFSTSAASALSSISDIQAPSMLSETEVNINSMYMKSESYLNTASAEVEAIGASADILEEYEKSIETVKKNPAESTRFEAKDSVIPGNESQIVDNLSDIKELPDMEASMMEMSVNVKASKTSSDELVVQTNDGFQTAGGKNKKKKRKNKKNSDNDMFGGSNDNISISSGSSAGFVMNRHAEQLLDNVFSMAGESTDSN